MDIVDLAQQHDFNEYALKMRRHKPSARGTCLYCMMELESNKIFCDQDCHKDYENEQRIKKLQGR